MPTVRKTRDTSVYVQTQPGKPPVYLGDCVDIDAIPNPRGASAAINCWNRNRDGFVTVGETIEPPGNLEYSLSELVYSAASYLASLNCPFTLFALQKDCGAAGIFNNWARGAIVKNNRISDDTLNNVAHHVDDTEMMHDYDLSGWVPRIDVHKMTVGALTSGVTEDILALSACKVLSCGSDCAEQIEPCDQFIAPNAAGAAATPDVLYSNNGGAAVAAAATDPFAIDEDATGAACFAWFSGGLAANRWLVGCGTTDAAAPAKVAFSDDGGATWTEVTVGATNAAFFTGPNSIFALDGSNIWAVTDQGNVFYSANGGETWTDQAAITPSGGNALNCVHFADDDNGYAVGDADTVIYTANGGETWTAAAATGLGVNLTSVVCFSRWRAIIGSAIIVTGALVMTYDGGATYEPRAFTGSTVEVVNAISFFNDLVGVLVSDTAAPLGSIHMTIDGGATWFEVVTPSNDGLTDIDMCAVNEFYVSGLVTGGAGALFKGAD